MKDSNIKVVRIKSWEELVSYQQPKTIFRGQSDASWPLTTSLERACQLNDGNLKKAREREKRLLLSFKRHFDDYNEVEIEFNDNLCWLAKMQHHGAPTRLLDWSYSIWVAAFFAVEKASGDSVIW